MLHRWINVVSPWFLIGTSITLLIVQQYQLSFIKFQAMQVAADFKNFLKQTSSPSVRYSETSLTGNLTDDIEEPLPGPYNLLEDAEKYLYAMERPTKECTLEYMNRNRLQQDHPCVIEYIRQHYLKKPAPPSIPLKLDYPQVKEPSEYGQPSVILDHLHNKTNGFFIECGALDGENMSNTLYMERFLNWTGILVEADQDIFQNLLSRKRKSWSLPVCLSAKPYPTQVSFRVNYALGQILGVVVPDKNRTGTTSSKGTVVTAQCFPLYSILLAVKRTEVDFFSLDVEGHELLILKTIPFDRVNIKTLLVEHSGGEVVNMGQEAIRNYMESQGFKMITPEIVCSDTFFIKKL